MTFKRLVPSLYYKHPTFAFIYFVCAIHHLGMGLLHLLQPHRFEGDVFYNVYAWLGVVPTGWVYIGIWLMFTIGAYGPWVVARVALAFGLAISIHRGIAYQMTPETGGALIVWLPIIGTHFVQLLEPPWNPVTQKMKK